MKRSFLTLLTLAAGLAITASLPAQIIGREVPELQLSTGEILRNVRLIECSPDTGVLIRADRILRRIPLQRLPPNLREALREEMVTNPPPADPPRPPASPPPAAPPAAPAAPPPPSNPDAGLIAEAERAAIEELRLHLYRAQPSVYRVNFRVREAGRVPGWSQIRVRGDAAFQAWDNRRRDLVWRSERAEIVFDIVDGDRLRASSVSYGGISRQIDY